ncbi:MAG: hypothetical protein KKG92_05685 [Gammaproteobacteria bacterium]|nr:hypothetical protein [Gammaproteobacteria bacterium]
MTYTLFDYVDAHGRNQIKDWSESLEKVQRAKLNERLDKLQLHGPDLYPEMMAGSGVAGIEKLKVKGKVQLRPLLCKGPIDIQCEYTLLMGAKEVGNKWSPNDAREVALARKKAVKAAPENRRKKHERVS